MNDNSAVLIAEHLSAKSHAGSDLRNVTIKIMRGEIHALPGDHDSGKGSFADLLSGANCSSLKPVLEIAPSGTMELHQRRRADKITPWSVRTPSLPASFVTS